MLNTQKRFLQILAIELEDLKDDIDLLIAECESGHQEGRSSEYVYLNNLAMFRNEERGIDHFIQLIREVDVPAFGDLDALIGHCRDAFRAKIRLCGLAPFIDTLVDRKIEKVKRYVTT